jgi:hypothetical protein
MSYWKTKAFNTFYLTAIFLLFVLASCSQEKPPAGFYAIDSLVTDQIKFLNSIKAGLYKEAYLSGKTDTLSYTPGDTLAWINELDIFRKLEAINKPINKDSYLIDDGLFDPSSNLTVKAFTSLKKLPVVYLRIYYQGNINKPRKIEALYDDSNVLYESARQLSMHFQQIDGKTVLTSYSIKGGQKIILGDTVAFYIKGKILVD